MAAGFEEPKAEAIVSIISAARAAREAKDPIFDPPAKKSDIINLRTDLKSDITALRADLKLRHH